jgi:hypothetical protein
MGTGYVNLWRLVHRAEEAIIEFDDGASVVAGALNDKMRITNSKIDATVQTQLVTELVQAVMVLDPTVVASLGTYPTGGAAVVSSPPA